MGAMSAIMHLLVILATLSGTVTDRVTGAPIAGATVSHAGLTARTDAAGRYRIEAPEGARLPFSAPGYIAGTDLSATATLFPQSITREQEAALMSARIARPRGLAAEGAADLTPRA